MLRRRRFTALAAIVCSAAVPATLSAQANGLTGPGTATYTSAQWGFFSCPGVNCTPATGMVDNTKTGLGSALTSDSLGIIGDGDASGSAGAKARSALVGPLATPLLKAWAAGVQGFGYPPGYSDPNYYMYGASAIANAVQYYGVSAGASGPVEFTVSMTFDAYLLASVAASQPFLNVSASLFAYDGVGANIELPFGHSLGGVFSSFSGTSADINGQVFDSKSFTFTVDPGAGFYLLAYLGVSVNGYPEGNNVADAYHTMTVGFEDQNGSLLTALVPGEEPPTSTVPEPGTWALMLSGLTALAFSSRRRQRASV